MVFPIKLAMWIAVALAVVVIGSAAGGAEPAETWNSAADNRGAGIVPPVFTNQSAAVLHSISGNARSGSFADIDNDGDPDLLIQMTSSFDRILLRLSLIHI